MVAIVLLYVDLHCVIFHWIFSWFPDFISILRVQFFNNLEMEIYYSIMSFDYNVILKILEKNDYLN